MVNDTDQVIGYFLTRPCVVTLRASEDPTSDDEQEVSIRMHPWMPLAREKLIPISTDWVVTMISPVEKVLRMYKEDVLPAYGQETDKSNSINESTQVGLTD